MCIGILEVIYVSPTVLCNMYQTVKLLRKW